MDFEYAIIGGGVVGLSIARGLSARGKRVAVFDGEDTDYRASRGNFGLIWVQSKGLQAPAYARWTRQSAALWRGFADELEAASGIDLALVQQGGWDFFFSEKSLHARASLYQGLADQLGERDDFEITDANKLKREEPAIGPQVVGALYGARDGHVNPLRLLQALGQTLQRSDSKYLTGCIVQSVRALASGFEINTANGPVRAQKVVLAAGLGAAILGPSLGFVAPVRPQRGQVIVTQKLSPFIRRPSGIIRQVDEGGVQIGDSNEEVGFDDSQQLSVMAKLAQRAVKVYPVLANASIVRSWSALRIMSPDGLPIYQESRLYPGAYLATCHSGITLAAAHTCLLPSWLEGEESAPRLEAFSEERFAL